MEGGTREREEQLIYTNDYICLRAHGDRQGRERGGGSCGDPFPHTHTIQGKNIEVFSVLCETATLRFFSRPLWPEFFKYYFRLKL